MRRRGESRETRDHSYPIYQLLDRHRVAVAPGVDFQNGAASFFRITFANPPAVLRAGLERIEAYLGGRGKPS